MMPFNVLREDLLLKNGITLVEEKRILLGRIIGDALTEYYNIYKIPNDTVFYFNSQPIKSEYLRKARNNRKLLNKIVYENQLRTPNELIDFISENKFDLFHYNGIFFNDIYFLLRNTSELGKRSEIYAFEVLEEYGRKKGIPIKVEEPTLNEDLRGIDGIFTWKNKKYTIQIKPLESCVVSNKYPGKYIVFCNGSLKDLDVDYFIATNKDKTLIFRAKNAITKPTHYIIPIEDLLET